MKTKQNNRFVRIILWSKLLLTSIVLVLFEVNLLLRAVCNKVCVSAFLSLSLNVARTFVQLMRRVESQSIL